jgi:hypothetical protein
MTAHVKSLSNSTPAGGQLKAKQPKPAASLQHWVRRSVGETISTRKRTTQESAQDLFNVADTAQADTGSISGEMVHMEPSPTYRTGAPILAPSNAPTRQPTGASTHFVIEPRYQRERQHISSSNRGTNGSANTFPRPFPLVPNAPTGVPTEGIPIDVIAIAPTPTPIIAPTRVVPSGAQTNASTRLPTYAPTGVPTRVRAIEPTGVSTTHVPAKGSSSVPTEVPTDVPTGVPSTAHINTPTEVPTGAPPARGPTGAPTHTINGSTYSHRQPAEVPTGVPTAGLTIAFFLTVDMPPKYETQIAMVDISAVFHNDEMGRHSVNMLLGLLMEPTSTTTSGAGHPNSSVSNSVTGDHPGFVHVASPSVASISGCRVPSTSRHGSRVLHQLALAQAGVSPLTLASCACRPVLMAGAPECSTGAHPTSHALRILEPTPIVSRRASRIRSCAHQWLPRPALPSPSRQ